MPDDSEIISNTPLSGVKISKAGISMTEQFTPSVGWQGHIELERP